MVLRDLMRHAARRSCHSGPDPTGRPQLLTGVTVTGGPIAAGISWVILRRNGADHNRIMRLALSVLGTLALAVVGLLMAGSMPDSISLLQLSRAAAWARLQGRQVPPSGDVHETRGGPTGTERAGRSHPGLFLAPGLWCVRARQVKSDCQDERCRPRIYGIEQQRLMAAESVDDEPDDEPEQSH